MMVASVMHWSLWNNNLVSWVHMTFSRCYRVQSLCEFKPFLWLASLIRDFHEATRAVWPPIPLHCTYGNALTATALSSIVFSWLDFTKSWSDWQSRSFKIFFQQHIFHDDDGSPYPDSSEPKFSRFCNLLSFLCLMQPVIWPFSNRLTLFPQKHGCLRNGKLLIAWGMEYYPIRGSYLFA